MMPRLGLTASITVLLGFVVLLVFVYLSLSFWMAFTVFVSGMAIISIYGFTQPELEAARRFKIINGLLPKDGPNRHWAFVGWDDHLMHAAPHNRPFDMPAEREAYDVGYNARLNWSREFTR